MMTLKQIAEKIAPLDGRDVASVHTKLRNPQITRLLTPASVGEGRTSAAYYATDEMIRARIFIGLMDLGLLSAEIEKVSGTLDRSVSPGVKDDKISHPESAVTTSEKGFEYPNGLQAIIRGTRAGEDWRVRLSVKRNADGERSVSAYVSWAEWGKSDRALRAAAALHDQRVIGTLDLFASDLIRPLLPKAEG